MSNYDPNAAAPGFSANGATAIDVGLRAFMLRVYNYMAAGVGLTGVAAFLTYQFTGPELLQSPLMWVFMLAPLGLVFFISARINHAGVLYLGGGLRRAQHLGLHYPTRYVGIPDFPVHGPDRHHYRKSGQSVSEIKGLDWMISIIGVGVFAGLTAYDTQRIKGMYDPGDDATSAGRKAVMGALSLYIDFINLFMMMLRLMGGRR